MPDADIDHAVDALIGAAYGSAGERCMAISVAVVLDTIADELVTRLAERARTLKIGNGMDPQSEMGPLVTAAHRAQVEAYIAKGVQEGATLLVDGRAHAVRHREKGFYTGATLFDHVSPAMRIYTNEIFGPVLCVVRVKNLAEAVALINAHEYGNGVSCFTSDGGTARAFSPRDSSRHGRHQCPDPGAHGLAFLRWLEALALWRAPHLRRRGAAFLHALQEHHAALAGQHRPGPGVCDAGGQVMTTEARTGESVAAAATPARWKPALGGILMNLALGSFYAISLFLLPLEKEFGWTRDQTSWVTTIGIVMIATTYILAGMLYDRKGPRLVAVIGGIVFSAGFLLASYINSLTTFYLTLGLCLGIGNGFGFVIPTSVASKWFPDKRG